MTSDLLFIGGEWVPSQGRDKIEVTSPNDEQVFATVPMANHVDVDHAVAAARHAFHSSEWREMSQHERAALLDRFADELTKNLDARAALTSRQNGMTIALATKAEGHAPVKLLRYYASAIRDLALEEDRPRVDGLGVTIVRREAVGVVAAIVPWNYPQSLAMFKIAPALAAGCTVVLKPSPETTLDSFEMVAAGERAGLPAGVLNVVTGGADVGGYLVSHPGVGKVAFTGSVAAGRKIGEACGRLFRPMTLELGGKSAAIVLDDSDMAATVQGIATSFMLNAGQTCYLSSRVLLPRSRYSEVVEAVAAAADSLTIGNSLDPATQVGPLISSAQRERVESYIRGGVADGARLVTGGKRPGLEKGWFLQPTVFADVDNRSKIAQEEIFGPVLTMAPYDSLDEAVAIANDSTYGLAGTIWTTDLERGKEVARRVEAGAIGINFFGVDVLSPFGGYKDSGIGRELGPEGLDAYFQVKSIFVPNASTN